MLGRGTVRNTQRRHFVAVIFSCNVFIFCFLNVVINKRNIFPKPFGWPFVEQIYFSIVNCCCEVHSGVCGINYVDDSTDQSVIFPQKSMVFRACKKEISQDVHVVAKITVIQVVLFRLQIHELRAIGLICIVYCNVSVA